MLLARLSEPHARLPCQFAKMDIKDILKSSRSQSPPVKIEGSPPTQALPPEHGPSNGHVPLTSPSLPPPGQRSFPVLPPLSLGPLLGLGSNNVGQTPPNASSTHQQAPPAWSDTPQAQAQVPNPAYYYALSNISPPAGSHRAIKRPSEADDSSGPAKKKTQKWRPEEDAAIIELRGNGLKWKEISDQIPGRTEIGCRLHYQNYLEKKGDWDEERKTKLARVYERYAPSPSFP